MLEQAPATGISLPPSKTAIPITYSYIELFKLLTLLLQTSALFRCLPLFGNVLKNFEIYTLFDSWWQIFLILFLTIEVIQCQLFQLFFPSFPCNVAAVYSFYVTRRNRFHFFTPELMLVLILLAITVKTSTSPKIQRPNIQMHTGVLLSQ